MSMRLIADIFSMVNSYRYKKSWSDAVDSRIQEMNAAGMPWREISRSEELSGTNQDMLAMKGPNVKTVGAIARDIQGNRFRMFDVVCDIATTRNHYQNSFHSVITVLPQQRFELPHFYLFPDDARNRETVTAYEPIQADALSLSNYLLESPEPFRVRSLFDTQFAYNTLCPAIYENQWAVEWTEPRLVIYRWNHVISPNQVDAHVEAAMSLMNLLKPASEAYLAQRDVEVNQLAKTGAF